MSSARKHKAFLKKSWTLRFVTEHSKKSVVIKIKPMHIMVFLCAVLCIFVFMAKDYNTKLRANEMRLQALKEANDQQTLYIEKLQAEKQQMAGLVDRQNLELAEKLRDIEQKNSEVRQIVGLKNKKVATNDQPAHRVIKANRSALIYKNMASQTALLHKKIDTSEKEVNVIEKKAIEYKEELERRQRALNAMPSIWPADGYISSDFGFRLHPVYGYVRYHSGIDIAAPYGEPIYSAAAGVVVDSGYMSGYGYCVKVDHGNGLQTLYGHCSVLVAKNGDFVRKGQIIARVGSTGVSTGPHLHYEVLASGVQTDPAPYLSGSGKNTARLN